MGAVTSPSFEFVGSLPDNSTLTLRNVSWEEYDRVLAELDEQPWLRVTYDRGRLEIMTLSPEHESPSRLFTHLISVLTGELDTDYLSFGSTTLRKKRIDGGLEADDCCYISDYDAVAGIKRLDLDLLPPPHLAIEVDISHESQGKFHIYAGLRVQELWRYDGKQMEFYRLAGDQYAEIKKSDLFPFLSATVLPDFIRTGETRGVNAMRRAFGNWVRDNKTAPSA